jgi:ribosomal protein S27AE
MYGMFHGLYDLESRRRAASAESSARRSETKAGDVQRELRLIAERLDKLVLVNMAMWSLVQERTGVSEEDLANRVQEIDLQDGVADGKVTRNLRQCPNCHRTMSRRHNKCLFCGSANLGETALENI